MTEDEKWDALRKTALSDHEPFCNYGQTNGREMCTCQILVDLVEGGQDALRASTPRAVPGGRLSSSDARKARLARQRALSDKAKRA